MTSLAEMKSVLADLQREQAELEAAIDDMIGLMAEAAPDQRSTGDWAPQGPMTRKYLALTSRQAEVEADITELGRAIKAADAPPSVH